MIDAAPFPARRAAPVPPRRRAQGLLLAAAALAVLCLLEALDYLGHPLPEDTALAVREAARERDAAALQRALDPQVLAAVDINRGRKAVAYGTEMPPEGRLQLGDTRVLHGPRSEEWIVGGERIVELVRNGEAVARATVPADGAEHELDFTVGIDQSSWVALRHFPQLHTNPVEVIVADQPIRASRESALWCAESIELLWERRGHMISEEERPAAEAAYERAAALFRARAEEAGE